MGRLVQTFGRRNPTVTGQLQTNPGSFNNERTRDSLYTPCDLVLASSRDSLVSWLRVIHPDGDIALRPFEGTVQTPFWLASARSWMLDTMDVIDIDGTPIYSGLTLPAMVPFGYRLAFIDEGSSPVRALSLSIDTQTDWATQKRILCINTWDDDCRFDLVDSADDTTTLASVVVGSMSASYLSWADVSVGFPRVFLYYWRGTTWGFRGNTANVIGSAIPQVPAMTWARYDNSTQPRLQRATPRMRIPFNAF